MRKQFFFSIFILLVLLTSFSGDKKNIAFTDAIRNAVIPLHPDSANAMLRLKNYLIDKRIVMISDGHQDGASKAQLLNMIRYMHEQCDFDVLLLESDLYDGEFLQKEISKNKDSLYPLSKLYIRNFISHCSQSEPMFRYATVTQKTEDPFILNGFDCDFIRDKHAVEFMTREIDSVFRTNDKAFASRMDYMLFLSGFQKLLQNNNYFRESGISDTILMRSYADTICRRMQTVEDLNGWWALTGRNIKRMIACYSMVKNNPKQTAEIREEGLWDNLQWLLSKRYSGKKVLVWASALHLTDNSKILKDKQKLFPAKTCGNFLRHSQWKDSIAFFPMLHIAETETGIMESSVFKTGCKEGLFLFSAMPSNQQKNLIRIEVKTENNSYRYFDLYEGFILQSKEEACFWIK